MKTYPHVVEDRFPYRIGGFLAVSRSWLKVYGNDTLLACVRDMIVDRVKVI